jgi:hypothetical protein
MSYAEAREYSDIYSEQAEVDLQARQAVRDLTVALGPVLNLAEGPSLDADDARSMKQHIETLQGQFTWWILCFTAWISRTRRFYPGTKR